jgi:hypothetical protein
MTRLEDIMYEARAIYNVYASERPFLKRLLEKIDAALAEERQRQLDEIRKLGT